MKTTHKALSSLPFVALALVAAACGSPVGAPCQSANGDFAVKYTLTSKTGGAKCDALVLAGDVIGVTSFNPRGAAGELPRYDLPGSVAMQTPDAGHELSMYVDDYGADIAKGDAAYALGTFTSAQPRGGVCTLPSFKQAHLKFAAVPATADDPNTTADESDPGLPAYEGTWLWSNVVFANTADAPGTAFAGTMKSTIPDEDGNACNFEYKALGLYPAIPCNTDDETKPIADADGNAPTDAKWTPTFEQKADVTLCSPSPDLAKNRPIGSGINPNFKTTCAEFAAGSTYFCVLDPAFGKTLLGQ